MNAEALDMMQTIERMVIGINKNSFKLSKARKELAEEAKLTATE